MQEKFLNFFNINVPIKDKYTIDEIKTAFLKESYSSGSSREQELYTKFFKECTNNEDIKGLIKLCKTSSTKVKRLYQSFSKERKKEFGIFWSKRFRVEKEIGEIVPRKNKIYTEIDNFKSYELTTCIAYEMAIRNTKVKWLFEKYDEIKKMSDEDRYLFHKFFTKNNFENAGNNPFIELLEEYKGLTFEEYQKIIMNKLYTYKTLIDKDYKKFIDEYINKCTELGISDLIKLQKKIDDELINHYFIYRQGYQRGIYDTECIFKEEISNSKKKNGEIILDNTTEDESINIRYEKITHNEFIQYQGIYLSNEKYYVNNILPNFSRQINDQNQIKIAINFSLPEDEIIEYIRRVKKKVNPKTPFELLGNKLKKANDSSKMNIISSNNIETTLDITKGEKPQNKLADMLYIYDMRQRGFSNTKIINELQRNSSNRNTNISEKTIKKYFEIAKDYIENERYKELITGKVVGIK